MPLAPAAQKSFTKWLAMIAENDFRDLPSIIAADAIFRSPVRLKPYPGRDADGARRTSRYDRGIPCGSSRSAALRMRFAKVNAETSGGLECRSIGRGG